MIKSNAHKIYFLVFTALLLLALCLVAMHLGAVKFSVAKGFELLFSPDNSNESFVLHHTRIPRIIAALIIGGALSLSGALYQGVIGNPLVSPGILGVLSGASFGAVLAMVFGFNLLGIELFCFIFGLVAMGFALFLSFAFDKNKTILMLILGGIICSSFFSAGVSALKILADPYNTLPNIVFWLMGSLAYIQKLPLLFVAVVFVAIFVLSVLLSRQIDILNLDEESAKSLGISVKKNANSFHYLCYLAGKFKRGISWNDRLDRACDTTYLALFARSKSSLYACRLCFAWWAFFALLRHHSAKRRDERNPHRHYHKCIWRHHLFCGAACVKEKI